MTVAKESGRIATEGSPIDNEETFTRNWCYIDFHHINTLESDGHEHGGRRH